MNAIADSRVRRLADALAALTTPLQHLMEYADEFRKRVSDRDEIEVLCIAALLRVEAEKAKAEILRSLDVLEEAATKVAAL